MGSSHELCLPPLHGALLGQITASGGQSHLDLPQTPVVGPDGRERSLKDDSWVYDWGGVRAGWRDAVWGKNEQRSSNVCPDAPRGRTVPAENGHGLSHQP